MRALGPVRMQRRRLRYAEPETVTYWRGRAGEVRTSASAVAAASLRPAASGRIAKERSRRRDGGGAAAMSPAARSSSPRPPPHARPAARIRPDPGRKDHQVDVVGRGGKGLVSRASRRRTVLSSGPIRWP